MGKPDSTMHPFQLRMLLPILHPSSLDALRLILGKKEEDISLQKAGLIMTRTLPALGCTSTQFFGGINMATHYLRQKCSSVCEKKET